MTRFLSKLFGTRKATTVRHTPPAPKTRLAAETLEAREVPAVISAYRASDYIVVSTDNAENNVEVRTGSLGVQVKDWKTGAQYDFSSSGLNRIYVYGGNAADRVVNNVSWLGMSAYGYAGNDYLEGYSAADYLYGMDGNDTLVGYSGDDYLSGGNGQDLLKGMAGNDTAYGGAGDDTLVGDAGNDYLHGEDGHDQITGGAGTDTLYGGNGNDTLVTIDTGTTDYADGQAGYDTAWLDENVTWNWIFPSYSWDTCYVERGQNVQGFANGADRTLDGDWIADPTDGTNYKSFRSNPLFGVGGPSVNDVDQGDLADCWIMAPLGSAANDNQQVIRSMVADFGDGTYGVRLGGSFYRVDGDLPTWSATSTTPRYAGLGGDGNLWAAIVEKAYTHYRTGANTYASLAWGDQADALRALNLGSVGQVYYAAGSNATTVANFIRDRWNNYQACTICTGSTGWSGLVGSHCYTVTAVYQDAWGNVTGIQLRNPWGGSGAYQTLTAAQLASAQIWVGYGNTNM